MNKKNDSGTVIYNSNKVQFPNKKYKIIYADPAWKYEDKANSGNRGVDFKYDTMSLEEICNLPVKEITDDNCILFIWGTWTHIKEVQKVIEAWGFEYKTVGFVWIKNYSDGTHCIGMGNWTRANTEYCLIATKGKPQRLDAGISQIIESVNRQHSQKPNIVRDKIIKLCGDLPRIELFARTKVHGWDVWGNDEKLNSQPLEVFTI